MAARNAIRDALLRYLLDAPGGFVVAVSGPWGSGKTHIWNEIAETLPRHRSDARTSYASLFGVGSIEDLRGALLTDLFTKATEGEVTKIGDFIASSKRRVVQHLPTILKALDSRIGAPFLSRVVDPTALLSPGSYVCLDDLERAADSLPLADILGFANLLAERRSIRVVLIYNDDHIKSRAADFSELSRAYRERVVRHSFRLSPDVSEIASSVPGDRYPTLTATARSEIVECMERAKCVNLRTMLRAFERVAEVRRVLGDRTRPAHLALVVALTIEDAEGSIEEPGFYDFNPISFSFARHRPPNVQPSQLEQSRLAFYGRHYSKGSPPYEFSRSICRLIVEGWVDPQELFGEVVPEIEAEANPVSRLLAPLGTRRLMYFSDAEHEEWLCSAREVLLGNNPVSASQISYIYTGCSVASAHLGRSIAPELLGLIREALFVAARTGDGSVDVSTRVIGADRETAALFREYDQELRRARRGELVQRMLEAVWARDTAAFLKLLESERADAFVLAVEPPVLEELHATRVRDRFFYFDSLLSIASGAQQNGLRDVSERLGAYLCACRMFEKLDRSDIHRMDQVGEDL